LKEFFLVSSSESLEHRTIKNIISTKLKDWIGASLQEYPSAGHELDIFAVTLNGISIAIEIIWSPTKQNFYRDLNIIQQSDANIKLVIANPDIIAKDEYQREFSKVAVAQRRKGILMHGELINGQKIVQDTAFLETEFKDIILYLIQSARLEGKIQTEEITPPEIPKPDKVQEHLIPNLFPIKSYPSKIFSAPTELRMESEVFKKLGNEVSEYPFILKSKKLYTFHNLKDPTSPFKPIITTENIAEENIFEWMQNDSKRKDLIRLLNLALRIYCRKRNLHYDREHKRYMCLLRDGKDNVFSWRGGSQNVKRVIAKKRLDKKGNILYCKHYAADLRFMFIDDQLFLKIEPTITFTSDGLHPFRSDKLTSLLSRWLPKQYNYAYLQLVKFWAKYLSKLDIMISIPAGEQKIEVFATPIIIPIEVGITKEEPSSIKLHGGAKHNQD